jgi:uncharacterized protein
MVSPRHLLLALAAPLLLWPALAATQDVSWVPNPRAEGSWAHDGVGVLGERAAQIDKEINTLRKKTGVEIAVVLLPSIDDEVPKDFATALFNRWGVGQEGKDNGVLVLHVLDQRRVEIEVGYGLEDVLPDARCKAIIDDVTIPFFRADSFADGHLETIRALSRAIQDPDLPREDFATDWRHQPGDRVDEPGLAVQTFMTPRRRQERLRIGLPLLGGGALFWIVWWFFTLLKLLLLDPLTAWRIYNLAGKLEYLMVLSMSVGALALLGAPLELAWAALAAAPLPLVAIWRHLLLKRLRNKPRVCADCKKTCQRLDEQADDEFLDAGQRSEERAHSIDYDVWRCACGWSRADAYKQSLKHSKCSSCGYRTWFEAESAVIVAPTYSSSGTRRTTWRCEHCKRRESKTSTIPRLQQSSSSSSSGGGYSGGGGGGGSFGGGSSGGGGAGGSY